NHGEDVKELYYYLDATPTHSYLKFLYKYPQAEFPYVRLHDENRARGMEKPEYELLDTGVFDDNRYWDVFVEYAKNDPEDILMRVTVHNRGPEEALLHVLPQFWFRNTWHGVANPVKPCLYPGLGRAIIADHPTMGVFRLQCDGDPQRIFTDNVSNPHLYPDEPAERGAYKDGFHELVVHGNSAAVSGCQTGTKSAAWYQVAVKGGGSAQFRLRLSRPGKVAEGFADFDVIFAKRLHEADEFYGVLQHDLHDEDARMVQRQAWAGMIWSKQFYLYDIEKWIAGDSDLKPPAGRDKGRNNEWSHLSNKDIISMPDKWEYPWYAAWDLAFHCLPLAQIDPDFAKQQLVLLTREAYMHPNGQLPAYEWQFSDVNPPVHAWATWRVFQMDRKHRRERDPHDHGDIAFLERVFHKLIINFTWWVNRKDAQGHNIFQGGFLGLDNIGVFDRSKPLPTGGFINQADGTSWMAMYSLNLLRIALELSVHNKAYEDIATKFFQHFLHIAEAMNNIGDQGIGLWDETDEFYYDVLNLPDGRLVPLKARSMVGLIPLFAVETLEEELLNRVPDFTRRLQEYTNKHRDLARLISRWSDSGVGERHLLSLLRGHRMKCLLRRMLDETEFLSDYGVRGLSKKHELAPYRFACDGSMLEVGYWPAESQSGLFGGNSNWRGPIWMPVNYLLIESLQKFHHYYGDDFKVECPTGSGIFMTLNEVADELGRRLTRLFLKGPDGKRPALKQQAKQAEDPHFKDYVLFYEYFHGDNGRGIGASHQTGWTGLVAKLLQPRRVPPVEPRKPR
ncbi:MAG TPA: glucosidase, partial [Roseimicrobium sp.]|nr:glucosidase [Roseimicrobium sp.]